MNIIDPTTLALVGKALDAAALRHAVHAQNVANAHAQDHTPSRVVFEEHMESLRQTLAAGGRPSLADVQDVTPSIVALPQGASVQLDDEVAAMAQNTLHYQALLKALDRQLGLVSIAAGDGRR